MRLDGVSRGSPSVLRANKISLSNPTSSNATSQNSRTTLAAKKYQFEFVELILLLELDKRLPVDQFEAAASQSTVPCLPLKLSLCILCIYIYI